jgi:cobalt/nickel transport system permease protein
VSTPLSALTSPAPTGRFDRFSPAARLVALALLVVGVAVAATPVALVFALGFAAIAVAVARPPWAMLRHRLAHVESLVVVLLIIVPLTTPGTPLVNVGILTLTQEGLARALTIAVKVNAAVLLMNALIGSLEPARLPAALTALRVPRGLVALFAFTLRFVALMREEAARLSDAMRVRAFVPRLNGRTLAIYGQLAALIVLRAYDRAARIDEAMRCRGFSGRLPERTRPHFNRHDRMLITLAAVAALALGGLSW